MTMATQIGDDGPNQLVGTSKPDVLDGRGGNDILEGLAGNDTLLGGDGDDRLDGGTGADQMSGGSGNDVYVVDNVKDTIIETQFNPNELDQVESSVSFTLPDNVGYLIL